MDLNDGTGQNRRFRGEQFKACTQVYGTYAIKPVALAVVFKKSCIVRTMGYNLTVIKNNFSGIILSCRKRVLHGI